MLDKQEEPNENSRSENYMLKKKNVLEEFKNRWDTAEEKINELEQSGLRLGEIWFLYMYLTKDMYQTL